MRSARVEKRTSLPPLPRFAFHGRPGLFLNVLFFSVLLFFSPRNAMGLEDEGPVTGFSLESVAIITLDDQGRKFSFPTAVTFDPIAKEIYVLNNGRSRIVVYGPEFYPLVSLGAGRGIETPNGMHLDQHGKLFICQRRTADKPSRISVLNAAFFKEKEFSLQDVNGDVSILPRRATTSDSGLIYIASDREGVIVLDQDGNYLRNIYPKDKVIREPAKNAKEDPAASKPADEDETATGNDILSALPAELMPGRKKPVEEEPSPILIAAVRIIEVIRDRSGRLYMLSQETSKIYVYSPEEEFLFSFGEKGGSTGKMSQPRGIALDEGKGVLYSVDYMRHTVLVHNMHTGKFLFEFGGKGWSPGWFQYPTSLAVDHKGQLIIADTFNHRVQVLELRFQEQTTVSPDVTPTPPDE